MLLLMVVASTALLVALFCREWGSLEGTGGGYMDKIKIVLTHIQVSLLSYRTHAVRCSLLAHLCASLSGERAFVGFRVLLG